MPTKISNIESLARLHLNEATPRFWSSAELTSIITSGIKDLWRDIADLKQEHFLSDAAVTLPANSDALIGVPIDDHKVFDNIKSLLTQKLYLLTTGNLISSL